MVDGVVLLVDAAEGPMPQTKFVTAKALGLGLRPIVVLNKVDKPDAEPDRALDECFDLFAALDADEDQLDFPHMYASGRSAAGPIMISTGRARPLGAVRLIVNHVPAPRQLAHLDEDFRMLATTLGADPFLGRILTGRVESGRLKVGATVQALSRAGQKIEQFRVSKIRAFRGLPIRTSTRRAPATSSRWRACPRPPWPTRSARSPSTRRSRRSPSTRRPSPSPSASTTHPWRGATARRCSRRVIRERLMKEAESNVAIRVSDTPGGEAFEVAGRGELADGGADREHAPRGLRAVRISRPRVLMREDATATRWSRSRRSPSTWTTTMPAR